MNQDIVKLWQCLTQPVPWLIPNYCTFPSPHNVSVFCQYTSPQKTNCPFLEELPSTVNALYFYSKIPLNYLSSKVKDLTTTAADGLVTSFLSNQCLQGEKSHASKTAISFFFFLHFPSNINTLPRSFVMQKSKWGWRKNATDCWAVASQRALLSPLPAGELSLKCCWALATQRHDEVRLCLYPQVPKGYGGSFLATCFFTYLPQEKISRAHR